MMQIPEQRATIRAMKHSWRTLLLTLGVLAALGSSLANAELPAPYGETTGFVVEGAFSVNGVTDDDFVDDWLWDFDVDPIVGLTLHGSYRFIDYVSAGVTFHYGFLKADGRGTSNEYAGFLAILAELRGHLPMGRFDPWVGLGIGYAMVHGRAEEIDFTDESWARLSWHGAGIGIGSGLNIAITERFSLGAFFRLIFGVWTTVCGEGEGFYWDEDRDCDDIEDAYLVDDRDDLPDMPHLWSVGINATYIIGN